MRNNSTRLQGKKKTSTSQYQSFEHNGIEICDPQRLESLKENKRRCTLHAGMASQEFANFIPKDDRPANSRDANPLVTIWILSSMRQHTKIQPPKHWTSQDSDHASPGKL